MDKEILTLPQVAEVLQISRAKLYEVIAEAEKNNNPLPILYLSDRTPRVKKIDLDVWLEKEKEIEKGENKNEPGN